MTAMASQATVAVSNLVTPIRSANRLSFCPKALCSPSMNMSENINQAAAKVDQANSSVSSDSRADRHPEEPSGTCTLTDAKELSRLPLQDITHSTLVPRPKTIEYPLHPLTSTETGPTPVTLKQITDASPKVFKPQVQVSEGGSRETASLDLPHKRKTSPVPNTLCAAEVLHPSGTLTPYNRYPRARRSAPHLGKYTHNTNNNNARQQAKVPPRVAQTPDDLKRQRTRTTSAKGVENWNFNASWATRMVDRSGQIILPAGTGWKGRTSVTGLPQPQHQKLPTGVIV
jgi:hypothetical protein